MSNNPHQSRSAQEQHSLPWQAPVALQTPSGEAEQDSADLYADHETSGLHATGHGAEGPGLASELVLTAIVALGVTMATCSALYFGGAFSAGAHPVAPSTAGAH